MKSLRFILLVIILYSSSLPVYAQLSLGSNPQPATPQAAEMTRYGGHNVNQIEKALEYWKTTGENLNTYFKNLK